MESDRDRYYDINKRYLMLVGQWPYQKPKESLFFFIVILILDASVLITQVKRQLSSRSFFQERKDSIEIRVESKNFVCL